MASSERKFNSTSLPLSWTVATEVVWHKCDTEVTSNRPPVLDEWQKGEHTSTLIKPLASPATRGTEHGRPLTDCTCTSNTRTQFWMWVLTICLRLNSLFVKNFLVRIVVDWLCREEKTKRALNTQQHCSCGKTDTEAEVTSKTHKQLQQSQIGVPEIRHQVNVVN